MLLGAALAVVPCVVLASALTRRWRWPAAWATAGFIWSLAVIGLVTLIPAYGDPGVVPAEGRLATCGELGGPAPEGFWIFTSGQRVLNTALFVPSGALLVVAAMRRPRSAVVNVLLGLVLLTALSAGIEALQLALARIDRACDLTDVVDNVSGAAIGATLGLPLALVLRPWRRPRPATH